MPGAYAHITLVNIATEAKRLKDAGLPREVSRAVSDNFRYCELGTVSPDLPYLAITDGHAKDWADRMHYTGVTALVGALAKRVQRLDGCDYRIALAWLMGYVAHVITDMTIHPVVELKVGPYHGNEKAHRVCELHQDAYIYRRMGLGGIQRSEHLDHGISRCVDAGGKFSGVVSKMWRGALEEVFPAEFASRDPQPAQWHASFVALVDKFAQEGGRLPAFARHVAVDCGLMYPEYDEIELGEYIHGIAVPTPTGTGHYDQVFDHALTSVLWAWGDLVRMMNSPDSSFIAAAKQWDLDTGRDDTGEHVFWRRT